MIFIVAHFIFAIIGVAALLRGEVALSRNSIITGLPARLIGACAVLTFPIAYIIGVCFGIYWVMNHPRENFPIWTSLFVNFGAFAIVGLVITLVGRWAKMNAPASPNPVSEDGNPYRSP